MPISWFGFEYETKSELEKISASNKEIVLLTQTFASPSTKIIIDEFKSNYKNVKHITYDSFSESAALNAYESRYGIRVFISKFNSNLKEGMGFDESLFIAGRERFRAIFL